MRSLSTFLWLILIVCVFACNEKKQSAVNSASTIDTTALQWQDLIRKHPDSLLLKENLLQHFRDQHQVPKALESVDDFLEVDSLNSRLWSIKAVLHYENEDTSASISAFEKAISIEPSLDDLTSLGSLYAGINHPRTPALTKVMRTLYPEKSEKEALFIEGTYFASQMEYAKAIQQFDRCIQLEFSFMPAYGEKSRSQMALYQYKDARKTLERAVKLQNNYLDGWFLLGQVCEELQDLVAAEAAYRRILLYDADYEPAKERLQVMGVK
jgi:tetratricopeptide (TPR) repeat protein